MAFTLNTGFDQVERIGAEIEARKAASSKGMFRFFIKPDQETKIIFLTSNPPVIKEHNIKLNGKFGNTFTCLAQMGQACPICETGDRPSDVGFFVVIDRTNFKDKNGVDRTDSVKVFPAKYKVLAQLKKFALKYGPTGLVGREFEVSRTSDKAPSTGDTFIPDGEFTEPEMVALINKQRAKVKTQDGSPLKPIAGLADVIPNWQEYLAPKDAAALRSLLGQRADEVDEDDAVNFDN